jgi:hypothetical protein
MKTFFGWLFLPCIIAAFVALIPLAWAVWCLVCVYERLYCYQPPHSTEQIGL